MDKLSLDARIAELKASPEKTVRKQFVINRERAVDDDARTVRFAITNGDIDRDEDTIDPKGWDFSAYSKNSVVMWAHDYAALPIARALDVTVVGNELHSTAQFPPKGVYPFADTVFELIKGGFLNACSVGFKPTEYVRDEKRGGLNFIRQTLLEYSVCGIPSNPGALVVARSQGIDLNPLKEWAEGILKGIALPQTKAIAKAIGADACKSCGADLGKMGALKENGDCAKCGKPAKAADVDVLKIDGEQPNPAICPACLMAIGDDGVCVGCSWRAPEATELVEGVQASVDEAIVKASDVEGEAVEAETVAKGGPGEEDAELVQYQTLMTMLASVGNLLGSARGIVASLISAERDTPTIGYTDEAAEETVEAARLESIRALCAQILGGVVGIANLAEDMLIGDRDQLPMSPTLTTGSVSASLARRRDNKASTAAVVCAKCHETVALVDQLEKEIKRGRVLSAANEGRLKTAKDNLDTVLEQVASAPEDAVTADALVITADVDADEIRMTLDIDDEHVMEIDLDSIVADDVDVTPEAIRASLRAAISGAMLNIVANSTQAAVNRLRGRVD